MRGEQFTGRLRPHLPAAIPGLLAVALFLLWAVHDGGYDSETWYWGALATLALLAIVVIALGPRRRQLPRAGGVALGLFAAYVAWSYLSITWAQSPGDALQGSDRALLYLLIFTLLLVLPWTAESALAALTVFAIGVGVIGIVLLIRFASQDHLSGLIDGDRLVAPTGYFNSTAALFTSGALVSICLAPQRRLPGPLRGLLLALACADLQLALIVQSRGWLFTLPLILLVLAVLATDRLRLAVFAVLPIAGTVIILHRLLNVFQDATTSLGPAAQRAGRAGLVACAIVFVVGTLLAWGDWLSRERALSHRRRRLLGSALSGAVVIAVVIAAFAATGGHPFAFIKRQWNGFSHEQTSFSSASHFGDVGSGRYDFWRVALDAFVAHPVGGLGQDNFDDYYVKRRHTQEEPAWTHSLEMRLLAHTGAVGFALFSAFMIAALALALRGRRRGDQLTRAVVAIALLPLLDWLIHGSIDWFWEMPALSGPALGFLGLAGSLGAQAGSVAPVAVSEAVAAVSGRRRIPRPVTAGAAVLALVAGVLVLGFPYLSVREVSLASNERNTNPAQALADINSAADLNPLSSEPGRLGGAIAMQAGRYSDALRLFDQSVARESGGWFSWLGAGLAASALGQTPVAVRDFRTARSINSQQPAIQVALARVHSKHPLTYDQMLKQLVLVL